MIVPTHHIVFFKSDTKVGNIKEILSRPEEVPFYIFKIKDKNR